MEYECSVLLALQMNIKKNDDYRSLNARMNRGLKKKKKKDFLWQCIPHQLTWAALTTGEYRFLPGAFIIIQTEMKCYGSVSLQQL